jgi:HK97 family phage portal protein
MANPFARATHRMREVGAAKSAPPGAFSALVQKTSAGAAFSEWSTHRAVKEGFKASTWVYTNVNAIMQAVGSVPWTANKRDGKEWVPAEGSPLQRLLDRPNPFITRAQLMKRLAAHLMLGGNGLFRKIMVSGRGGRQILGEIWPIDPSGLKPIPDPLGFISAYEWTKPNGQQEKIPAEEVIHMMLVDPSTPYWGMSPLQAAARVVDTDIEAVKWNMASLQNRTVPDGVFTFKEALDDEAWDDARQQLREQYQGGDNARTPLILGGGADWKPMSLTPAEMDWLESRKLTREEICAVYRVPPPMVGIYDNATLANIETARKIFWLDTIIPLLDEVRDALNLGILPFFGNPDDLWINYDLSNVSAVREDMQGKVDTGAKLFSMGVPVSQIAEICELDIEEYEGWDQSLVPTTVQPLEMLLNPEVEPVDPNQPLAQKPGQGTKPKEEDPTAADDGIDAEDA